MAEKLNLTVSVDGNAKAELKAISDQLANTGSDAQDLHDDLVAVPSATKQMADALSAATAEANAALNETKLMSDAVAKALGPDMAQALGESRLAATGEQLREVGITAHDVSENVDGIADALRGAGQAQVHADNLGLSLERVRDTSQRARTAVANIATGVPEISQALGPVNAGVNQMVQGLAAGGTGMKAMIGAGAGLAVVSLVMKGISDHAKKVAEAKAFDKAQVSGYEKALLGADSKVEAIRKHLEEVGKVQFTMLDSKVNITGKLAELGLTAESTAKLIAGGKPSIEAWSDAMEAGGASAGDLKLAALGLEAQVRYVDQAAKGAAVTTAFLGETSDELAAKQQAAAANAKALTEQLKAQAESAWSLYAAEKSLNDQITGKADTWDAWIQAQQNAATATDDWTTAVNEQEAAQRQAAEAAAAVASQAVELKKQQVELAGGTYTARDAARDQVTELGNIAASMAPNSPIRVYIEQLIGRYQALQELLDLKASAAAGGGLSGDRFFELRDILAKRAAGLPGFASGTSSAPDGPIVVGENGPEVISGVGGRGVIPNNQLGGATNVNITVSAGMGADGNEIGRQIRDHLAEFYRNGGQAA